jgi:thymidylate kinase
VLETLSALFERLNAEGIRYCHWKSNWVLDRTLDGETDVDLLLQRQDATAFRQILQDLGFRPAVELGSAPFPSVEHYYALDEASDVLAHVHAYYRVISGDSVAKNYRLPFEGMLLQGVTREGVVNVPAKGAELVSFVLRMSLKHATATELLLLARHWEDLAREVEWLDSEEARAQALALLPIWLPGFDESLFSAALEALRTPAPVWRRVVLGRRVRARLRPFARRGRVAAWLATQRRFLARLGYRLRRERKGLTPAGGGAILAFVGSEATGKSTLLAEMERWLGEHYTVRRVHAGKPPSTWLTLLPNLLVPMLRRLLPRQRSGTISAGRASEQAGEAGHGSFPLLFGIRAVCLAYDRRALLTRAFASSANGTIVLCDRYPSEESGALDGAQLLDTAGSQDLDPLRRRLVDLEARLYQDVCPPDLAILLTAPLEVTLERNRARAKTEDEDYVIFRHARSSRIRFDRCRVHKVDTNRPLEDCLREIRRVVWEAL